MTAYLCGRCRLCGVRWMIQRSVWPDRMRLHFYECAYWPPRAPQRPAPLRKEWNIH